MRSSNALARQDVDKVDNHPEHVEDALALAKTMEHLLNALKMKYKQQLVATLSSDPNLGKLAYVEGSSRYIQGRFWAGRYEEVCRLFRFEL